MVMYVNNGLCKVLPVKPSRTRTRLDLLNRHILVREVRILRLADMMQSATVTTSSR